MSLSIKKKAIKKAVSVVTTIATVVCMSGVASFSVTSLAIADVVDGALIKSNATNPDGTPTLKSLDVYIVKLVGTKKFKRLVLNPTVFNSYGHLNWGDIQTVSQSVMDEYTNSGLVRVDTDPDEKVYAMAPDGDVGSKSWVNVTAEKFLSVSGSEGGDSIYTINATDAGSYTAVGDITGSAELETFYSAGTLPAAAEAGTGLTIALASDTPASTTIPDGATGVVMTKVNITASSDGDVTIQSLNTSRSGVGTPSNINKVYLYEGGSSLTSTGKTVNSTTNESIFTNLNFVVPAGTTKTLDIVVNITADATDNHAMGISDASDITTNGAAVNGSFPVMGNIMSIANVTLGTAAVTRAGSGTYTRNIGEKEAIVAKFTVTTANEDSKLQRMSIYNSQSNILDNMTLWRGGSKLADGVENGRYFDFVLDTPNTILKGEAITYTLKADVFSDNVSDYAYLYFKNKADLIVVGDTYGYGVTTAITSYDASSAAEYTKVQLEAGDVTIISSGPSAADVAVDKNDITLMNLSITALNATRIEAFGFDITASAGVIGTDFENTEFYCDDIGLISSTGTSIADQTWTDEFDLEAGKTYECLLRIDSTTTPSDGETIYAALDITDWSFRDVNTDTAFASTSTSYNVVPTSDQTGYTMTMRTAGLAVVAATAPAAQNWVKGGSKVPVAGYTFTAADADDILVQDITFTSCYDTTTSAASMSCGSTSNNSASSVVLAVYLYDGDTLVAGPKSIDSSGQVAFTDIDWTVTKGNAKTLTIKADLNTSLPGNATRYVTLGLETASVTSYYDGGNKTVSGNDPASNLNTDAGATNDAYDASSAIYQTVHNSGTLAVDIPTSTPITDIAVAGASDVEFADIKFTSAYEDMTVTKMALYNVYTSTFGDYDNNIAKVSVRYPTNGSGSTTETKECTLTTGIATCTGLNVFVPNPDTVGYNNYAVVEVITDMQTIAAGATAAEAPKFTLSLAGDLEAIGNDSGSSLYEETITITDVTGGADSGSTYDSTAGAVTASTDVTVGVSASSNFAVGDIIWIDEDASTTYDSATEEYMYVSRLATGTTLTVVRNVNADTAVNTYTNGKKIYKITSVLATNAMNVQGTKVTVANQMTSKTGGQNATEEIMEFKVTADAIGDASIRQGLTYTGSITEGTDTSGHFAVAANTTYDLDGSSQALTWSGAGEANSTAYFTSGTGVIDDYTRISGWLYLYDHTGSEALTLSAIKIFTSTGATVALGQGTALSSTCTEGAWCQFDIAMPTGTLSSDVNIGIEIDGTAAANGALAASDVIAIDDLKLYNEKIQVDLTLNKDVTIPAGGNTAYLKQNGGIVATGTVGWDLATASNNEAGAVIFVPVGSYGDIEISGEDTFNVEINTTVFTEVGTSTELMTATIDLGNSSSSNTDLFWYDTEGSDTVPYVGVNSTDKISTTITY